MVAVVRRSVLLVGGGVLAVLAIWLAMSGPASAACPSGARVNYYTITGADSDGDGLNDTGYVFAEVTGGTGDWVNSSIFDPVIMTLVTTDYDGPFTPFITPYDANGYMTLPAYWGHRNYSVGFYLDDGSGPCEIYGFDVELWPLGSYLPAINSSEPLAVVEQNTTANFTFRVTNNGNNPDTFSFIGAFTSCGSPVTRDTPGTGELQPGGYEDHWVNFMVPRDTPPRSDCILQLFAGSTRDGTQIVGIDLTARVANQTFALDASSPNGTLMPVPGSSVIFEVDAQNLGNNRDTFWFSVSTPPSGWSAAFVPNNVTASFETTGSVLLVVTAPLSLAGATSWSPVVTVLAGDNVTADTVTLSAVMALPDFAIVPANILVGATAPIAGSSVTVDVTVHNTGIGAEVSFAVRLSDGLVNQSATVQMGLSGTATASFTWVARQGATLLTVTLDAAGAVPESNEANNAASVAVTVDAKPVAVLTPVSSASAGAAVTFSASGSSDAEGAVAGYYFDFGDGTNSDWVTNASASHTYSTAGTFTVHLKVRDAQGAESDQASQSVVVGAASAPAGGDSSILLYLLIAVVAAGAVVAVVLMKRKKPGAPAPPAADAPQPPEGSAP